MNNPNKPYSIRKEIFRLPVIVAALGYLVDMYDLFLFNVVRVPSLTEIGVERENLKTIGLEIQNFQLIGLLIGGVLWGVLGDKKGRLSVLFGSIVLYSVANIANGFVNSVETYKWLRFVAGIGLAGELGAGITLVAEILPKEIRGYGTTVVATMGLLGAIASNFVLEFFDWRITYIVGGVMGIILLFLRFNVFESSVFKSIQYKRVEKGNFLQLFNNFDRFKRYTLSILIGIPIWFVGGIILQLSPEFGRLFGVDNIMGGRVIMFAFTGQIFGDIVSGLMSQYFKSRKKAFLFFVLGSLTFILFFLLGKPSTEFKFYLLITFIGFFNGYWTLFITIAAELFGTNLRATVATSVPNVVRASAVPMALALGYLEPKYQLINSALIIALVVVSIALVSWYFIEETFHKDMDYLE